MDDSSAELFGPKGPLNAEVSTLIHTAQCQIFHSASLRSRNLYQRRNIELFAERYAGISYSKDFSDPRAFAAYAVHI